jgi:hypothetical protein
MTTKENPIRIHDCTCPIIDSVITIFSHVHGETSSVEMTTVLLQLHHDFGKQRFVSHKAWLPIVSNAINMYV